ncbi:MAG: phytanoyl-CoA dioxygenase family protein [Bacteroidetes bacterium]|nr:phytanoyl-CoA dioxygenase family protein [Bacteroidota bacterium]
MDWTYLEKLWERTVKPGGLADAAENSWSLEIEALYKQGIGMEKTLQFLYREKPDLTMFKKWIEAERDPAYSLLATDDEPALSREDLDFWDENGYVVLKQVVSRTDCEAAQQAILDFLGTSLLDHEGWYKSHSAQGGLMLNFTNHPALNKNRQTARIRKAYEQLYARKDIVMTIDKVSFNPPETNSFSFRGSPLHWDTSLKQPIAFSLQGLLYLTDCGPQDGAFHCVPGFHKSIGNWLQQLAPDENPREAAPRSLKAIPVTGQAGDFVIWHAALPHAATANHGKYPRMVQYLTYLPLGFKEETEWI